MITVEGLVFQASKATKANVRERIHLNPPPTLPVSGGWLPWLEREFGWEETTALRFMCVHELAIKSGNLQDLELPVSGLYLLAAPSTPEEARAAVVERVLGIRSGHYVERAAAGRIIARPGRRDGSRLFVCLIANSL